MNMWSKKSKDADPGEDPSSGVYSQRVVDDVPVTLARVQQSLEALNDKLACALETRPSPAPGEADAEIAALLFERLVLPMIEDLMAYYDRLQHAITPLVLAPELDAGARQTLVSLDAEVLDILARHQVERAQGDVLDPSLHQVRARVSTNRPDLDRKIAKSHRCGFRRGSQLLRREEVDVYRYDGSGG
jgi:predicted RecB family endonuclease